MSKETKDKLIVWFIAVGFSSSFFWVMSTAIFILLSVIMLKKIENGLVNNGQ